MFDERNSALLVVSAFEAFERSSPVDSLPAISAPGKFFNDFIVLEREMIYGALLFCDIITFLRAIWSVQSVQNRLQSEHFTAEKYIQQLICEKEMRTIIKK